MLKGSRSLLWCIASFVVLSFAGCRMVGCETGNPACVDNCLSPECVGDLNCLDASQTPNQTDWQATLHLVAPYEWVGDFWIDGDVVCNHESECLHDIDDWGEHGLIIYGETFTCVMVNLDIVESQNGLTIPVEDQWSEPGICGLTPDGRYGNFNVSTSILDINGFDQVWIHFGGALGSAVLTKDIFYDEDESRILDGTIDEDLSCITYRLTNKNQAESVSEVDDSQPEDIEICL